MYKNASRDVGVRVCVCLWEIERESMWRLAECHRAPIVHHFGSGLGGLCPLNWCAFGDDWATLCILFLLCPPSEGLAKRTRLHALL